MSRHSSVEIVWFMSRLECLVSRQFLDALHLEYLNSMLQHQNSLSQLSFLLLRCFMSRHRIFVSRQSFSVFCFLLCRDIKLFYRNRNLLLGNFYCRNKDFCLIFFTVSQHKFLVILLNFYRDSSYLCHNKVHFNLMLCFSRHKNYFS